MPLLQTLTLATMLWSGPAAWASVHPEASPDSAPGQATREVAWRPPVPWVSPFGPLLALGVGPDAARRDASAPLLSLSSVDLGREEPWRHLRNYGARLGAGGSFHFDIGAGPSLRTGPEVSWLSPNPPREGWLKTRVVTPGWSIWYAPTFAPLAVGLSTSTRFVLTEQSPTVVDLFTSQAHVALRL